MSNHRLEDGRKPLSNWFGIVYNLPHRLLLLFRQYDVPGSPVLFYAFGSSRSWDGNQPLCSNPGKSNLRNRTTLSSSQFLDFGYYCLVLIKVLSLEFGNYDRKFKLVFPYSLSSNSF